MAGSCELGCGPVGLLQGQACQHQWGEREREKRLMTFKQDSLEVLHVTGCLASGFSIRDVSPPLFQRATESQSLQAASSISSSSSRYQSGAGHCVQE